MADTLENFFDPERLNKNWMKTNQDVLLFENEEALAEPKAVFAKLHRFIQNELGEQSKGFIPLMDEVREILNKQFNKNSGEELSKKEIQENKEKLEMLFNQIEDLLDACLI